MIAADLIARLEALRIDLPDLRLHALIDGLLYHHNPSHAPLPGQSGVLSLLAGTIDDMLSEAGPWLIDPQHATPGLWSAVERLEAKAPAVTWIISPMAIDALGAMLGDRLNLRLPDDRIAMLRFWDPRVLATLGRDLNEAQRREFFGDIVEWHLLLDGRRVHIARHHADAH
ncbi:DUF4123 domain-containing protein [Herbaspirillum robiniae]|uniref:DUF4123 domain-containing protein n=1 Tax=Herbaspirillum robiniae TaxID=2014887 RepID=A0A246WM42_9BURK|nr:DUF4123 domain-containing protein [Herbaspirillum robiniae]OWY27394.1 hypothetical protein CEJ42_20325 [Herbaspirillum robiniae]